jgi:hypothetical protein
MMDMAANESQNPGDKTENGSIIRTNNKATEMTEEVATLREIKLLTSSTSNIIKARCVGTENPAIAG